MNDLELMLLENSLRADAAYISGLAVKNDQAAIHDYMTRTDYLNRMQQWKAAHARRDP